MEYVGAAPVVVAVVVGGVMITDNLLSARIRMFTLSGGDGSALA